MVLQINERKFMATTKEHRGREAGQNIIISDYNIDAVAVFKLKAA